MDLLNSAENVMNVLFVWLEAKQFELGLTEIQRLTGINKSTVYKILQSLRGRNLVSINPVNKKYSLDVGVMRLNAFLSKNLDLRSIAHPYLERLAQSSGKTVTMGLRKEDHLVFIDRVDGTESVRFFCDIGKVVYYNSGAAAKAVFAYLPDEKVRFIVEESKEHRFTERSKSWLELLEEAPLIRDRGYSISDEEVDRGVIAVGAPLFDSDGEVCAGIAMSTLKSTLSQEELEGMIALILKCSDEISARLGYSKP